MTQEYHETEQRETSQDRTAEPEVRVQGSEPPAGFTQVPNEVLLDPALSHGARLTYAVLKSFAWGDPVCFPGMETLAKILGVSRRTVLEYVKELEDAGLITVKRRRGRRETNIYRFRPLTSGLDEKQASQHDEKHASHDEYAENEDTDYSRRGADTPQPKGGEVKADRCVAKLTTDLELIGHYLDEDQKEKWGRNFKFIISKGASPQELFRVVARIVAEWPRIQLSPQQALRDVRGEGPGARKQRGNPTPEAAIRVLRESSNFERYANVAEEWDFTAEENPPDRVLYRLGGTPEERHRNLARLRSVARRAVREAQESHEEAVSGPSPASVGVEASPQTGEAERARKRKVVEEANEQQERWTQEALRVLNDSDSTPARLVAAYHAGKGTPNGQLTAHRIMEAVSEELTGHREHADRYGAAVLRKLGEKTTLFDHDE